MLRNESISFDFRILYLRRLLELVPLRPDYTIYVNAHFIVKPHERSNFSNFFQQKS